MLPEPVEVLVVVPIGASVKLIGKGLNRRKAVSGRSSRAQEGARILKGSSDVL
jgi:hypothetical protein